MISSSVSIPSRGTAAGSSSFRMSSIVSSRIICSQSFATIHRRLSRQASILPMTNTASVVAKRYTIRSRPSSGSLSCARARMNATSKMTNTAVATSTVPMLRLTITLSSLPLSLIPSRAAHQSTLPAKESSATVRQLVRLGVPSNRSMSPIMARRSNRFEFRSSKLRAQLRCYRRVGEEGANGSHSGALGSRLALSYAFFSPYSPKCVEEEISEIRLSEILGRCQDSHPILIQFTSLPATLCPTASEIKGDTESVREEGDSSSGARHGGARRGRSGLCCWLQRRLLGAAGHGTRHREGEEHRPRPYQRR